jgi:ABC-2 type transport system ATP-binding protein
MLELRERGTTLMLTTHDMAEADRLCDRIAIVDHGKVIALDTPRGLRRLLPAENGIELILEGEPSGAFDGIGERTEVVAAAEGRWSVRLYGDVEVADALAAADGDLVEMRRLEGSLEDVFVHLTGRELR